MTDAKLSTLQNAAFAIAILAALLADSLDGFNRIWAIVTMIGAAFLSVGCHLARSPGNPSKTQRAANLTFAEDQVRADSSAPQPSFSITERLSSVLPPLLKLDRPRRADSYMDFPCDPVHYYPDRGATYLVYNFAKRTDRPALVPDIGGFGKQGSVDVVDFVEEIAKRETRTPFRESDVVVKRCPDGSWEVRLSLSSAKTESQLPARGAADPEKKPVEPAADKTYH